MKNFRLPQNFVMILVLMLASLPLFSQGFQKAKQQYQNGDFQGAEKTLQILLIRDYKPKEKAQMQKLLGIVQYMQGQKSRAEESFKFGLEYDETLTVAHNEVLDPTIINSFNHIKQQWLARRPKKTPPPAPQAHAAPKMAKKKFTSIRIESNVPTATLIIDGIKAEFKVPTVVDPGKISVEISAPGYIKKKVHVQAVAHRESVFQIPLEKVPPPKPTPKPQAAAVVAAAPNIGAKEKAPTTPKSLGDKMFEEKPPVYSQNSRDLKKEFQQDSQTQTLPPVPPFQGTPYVQQPYAPAPYAAPLYQAPQPYISAPVQPSMPPPPPPLYNEPYQDPAALYGAKKKKAVKPHKENSLLLALLPFGVGQFQNGNIFLGLIFLGGEAGALYFAFDSQQKYDQFKAERDEQAAIWADPTNQSSTEQSARDDYYAQSETYLSELSMKRNLGIIAFGGLWVVGAIEAIINDPLSAKKKTYSFIPLQNGLLAQSDIRSLSSDTIPIDYIQLHLPYSTQERSSHFQLRFKWEF